MAVRSVSCPQQFQDCGLLSNPSICRAPETARLETWLRDLSCSSSTTTLVKGMLGKSFAVHFHQEFALENMHVPKKLACPSYCLWWPTSFSCMAYAGSIFGLGSFSRHSGGCVDSACHKRQTDVHGSWRPGNWMTNWQTGSAFFCSTVHHFHCKNPRFLKTRTVFVGLVIN